jgi:hypothetical protein
MTQNTAPQKIANAAGEPQYYQGFCSSCRFIGHFVGHDVYICGDLNSDEAIISARYESDPGHVQVRIPCGVL